MAQRFSNSSKTPSSVEQLAAFFESKRYEHEVFQYAMSRGAMLEAWVSSYLVHLTESGSSDDAANLLLDSAATAATKCKSTALQRVGATELIVFARDGKGHGGLVRALEDIDHLLLPPTSFDNEHSSWQECIDRAHDDVHGRGDEQFVDKEPGDQRQVQMIVKRIARFPRNDRVWTSVHELERALQHCNVKLRRRGDPVDSDESDFDESDSADGDECRQISASQIKRQGVISTAFGMAPQRFGRCASLNTANPMVSYTTFETCAGYGLISRVQCDVDPGEVSAASHWSPSRIPITQADRLHPDWLDETADTHRVTGAKASRCEQAAPT